MAADPIPHDPPGLDARRARIDEDARPFLDGVRAEMAGVAPRRAAPDRRGDPAGRSRRQAAPAGVLLLGLPSGGRRRRRADRAGRRRARAAAHDGADPRRPHGSERRNGAVHPPARSSWPSRRGGVGRPTPSARARPSRWWPAISPAVLADRLLLEPGFPPTAWSARSTGITGCGSTWRSARAFDVAGGDLERAPRRDAQGRVLHRRRAAARSAPRWRARTAAVTAALAAYGAPLGLAFQLLDDERDGDGDARPGAGGRPVAQARAGLDAPGSIPRRFGRSLAGRPGGGRMTGDLEFLRRAFRDVPTCHLSTLDPAGAPHVAPSVVRVARGSGLFISTRRGDAAWENVLRDPRVSVVDRPRA